MTPQAQTLLLPPLLNSHENRLRLWIFLLMLMLATSFSMQAHSVNSLNQMIPVIGGPDSISIQDFPVLQVNTSTDYAVEVESTPSVLIAPNPTQGKISILIPQELTGMTGRISILDETGKSVYSSLMNPGNPEAMTIDLSSHRNGKYTALIKGNKGSFRSSFLLIH